MVKAIWLHPVVGSSVVFSPHCGKGGTTLKRPQQRTRPPVPPHSEDDQLADSEAPDVAAATGSVDDTKPLTSPSGLVKKSF